ncbi:unnamed protein product [Mytilus edulis]|uniref:Tc1-like transposase DDE domain-containing protein n=1 Tax=Mytilus edulis TaxID=6550 RepID=A0A8S3S3K3_MYTED|nr:unnamed protein product [Mytilus edulis]
MEIRPGTVKPTRLSVYIRERILSLRRSGKNITEVRDELIRSDNVQVSRQGISAFLRRFRQSGSVTDFKVNTRQKMLQEVHLEFIDETIRNDREISAREVAKLLTERFHIPVSETTIKRARQRLGWKHSPTQYCQMVREVNKPKRVNYALECIINRETFDNVIFTDETTVKIQSSTRYSFRKEGEETQAKGKPKHPYQVHVWGGISRQGPTGLYIFTGIMDSVFYQEILNEQLLPFIQEKYPNGHRLVQDNDPKHVSRSTKQWMQDNNVNHWVTPPESPDLNPIENIWAALKFHIRRRVKPSNQQELLDGIQEYWNNLSAETCCSYINHLYKVLPKVLDVDGNATGY